MHACQPADLPPLCGRSLRNVAASQASLQPDPPGAAKDRPGQEQWTGPDGVRPQGQPHRAMSAPSCYHRSGGPQIRTRASWVPGQQGRPAGVIRRGSVLEMVLGPDEKRKGQARLVLVEEVHTPAYHDQLCPPGLILPISGVEVWDKEDMAALEESDDVPHAKRLSESMRDREVLQTVFKVHPRNRKLSLLKVRSIGLIVYDDEWLSTRGLNSDPQFFWEGFRDLQLYWCTGVCMLRKLPDEFCEGKRPRTELCVAEMNWAPQDPDGVVERHPRDLFGGGEDQATGGGVNTAEAVSSLTPANVNQFPAPAAQVFSFALYPLS